MGAVFDIYLELKNNPDKDEIVKRISGIAIKKGKDND